MYYLPSSNEPPMGRLAFVFCLAGVLAVAPILSWVLVQVLAVVADVVVDVGVGVGERTAFWVWLGGWALGNAGWLALSYLVDAWDAGRCADEHAQSHDPVILRWRNRMLVSGDTSRLRRITWCCVGLGIRIVLYPALTALCVVAALGFASIEEAPDSVGPQPLIALCFAVAAVVLTAVTARGLWENAHRLRHGRIVTGTVTDAGVCDVPGASALVRIDYRFRAPAGEEQVGSELLGWRPPPMPTGGDELVILHDERLGPLVL